MLTEMNNMTNQMNNLFRKVEFIETLLVRQFSESEHSNDHHKNPQRPVPRRNRQYNQHQDHNDFDEPNDSERSNDYRQRPTRPRNCQYNCNQGHHDYVGPFSFIGKVLKSRWLREVNILLLIGLKWRLS